MVSRELLDPAVVEHRAVLALGRCQAQGHPTETAAMPSHFPLHPNAQQLCRGQSLDMETEA